jgi:NADH dehydrogenase
MILIIGASGRLGSQITRTLLAHGASVRTMSREPAKLAELIRLGAEPVVGDLRDPTSLAGACNNVEKVVAAAHAFEATRGNNPRTVDDAGNRHLIDASRAAGVKHFVFTSVYDARRDHPVDFFRIKFRAEEYLRASGLSYTILRPTAFMEFWGALVGEPIAKAGRTTIFGRGTNPVNFVSVIDVAEFAVMALDNPAAQNDVIEIGGPENLSLLQVAEVFERVTGKSAKKSHVPLAMMRVMKTLMKPFNETISRQIAAGVYMDTAGQRVDMTDTLKRYPLSLTRLEDVVRAQYGLRPATKSRNDEGNAAKA